MKKQIRFLVVKAQYIKWALERANKPHIGDLVTHKGEDYMLINGAGAPYWHLKATHSEKHWRQVHRSEFRLRKSISRKWWAFKQSYNFQMVNWYSIDTWNASPLFKRINYIGRHK